MFFCTKGKKSQSAIKTSQISSVTASKKVHCTYHLQIQTRRQGYASEPSDAIQVVLRLNGLEISKHFGTNCGVKIERTTWRWDCIADFMFATNSKAYHSHTTCEEAGRVEGDAREECSGTANFLEIPLEIFGIDSRQMS